jgi:ribonuclease VapC
MFIDASALCAVLLGEAESDEFVEKIRVAGQAITSPVAVYEATLALARVSSGDIVAAYRDVESVLRLGRIEIVSIGLQEAARALDVFDRFGEGRHPARLNMGDCFAYACAKTHGVPLLFKGDDFTKTDVAIA